MQTALRKMGNSTGMILPQSVLREIGATSGAKMDVLVQDGKLIITPVAPTDIARTGWAESAADVAAHADSESESWHAFANIDDADLTW
ncbi:MAG: hypothetical protein V4461_07705 [Pseudomonadota bacterium]|jgi:antitoxin MazE|uniref:AbrB/MazE/SpoVT family DNA-binding domain-containing protein n=1 Tax=unclassified Sphingobium TaxID=2611147 RepID=UPI001E2EA04E|nr:MULTISPECIES: hypothetical protein [unclassified Sphingobium]GLI97095.1 hypothetical protein Sbs19_09130 [Sphingobium sp. BS19]CAH0349299.1 hypothetical protein SPH9361_00536 [Sphingobium sp. CECT 9361]|tara:strand:+ start:36 stop:299 length:264 start_codon:yes stop_codon:yes gene_type:complete